METATGACGHGTIPKIKNALKDGFIDIGVVVPGMGHHYMKMDLVDATFNVRHPEILVYEKKKTEVLNWLLLNMRSP